MLKSEIRKHRPVVCFRLDEAELLRARDEERHHNDQLRHNLEESLDNERRERLQTERAAQAEIERLRREIEALKNARPEPVRRCCFLCKCTTRDVC